jgi:hypothetical protein
MTRLANGVFEDGGKQYRAIVTLDQLVTLVQNVLVKFAPAAINGALRSYYTDVRIMMQTRPYTQRVVGIGNTK